ncbi:YhcN/YlaJ family sporulation lipoprotein [Paenibacillus kobensis]|uniref:YhcN/YlaJ family sporulation lipoprotein n=1 Tax=Paenibacillus kobensis TaxID=59841 RepID=UPI000FD79553|nr:YhcN/YlaJ family sporulation lipoprotein [Paenibacillus kobensis]
MRKKTGALLLTATLMVSMTTACGAYRDNNKVDQYRTRNISEPAPYLNQSRPYSTPYGSRSFTGYSNNTGARYLNHDGDAAKTASNKALADRIAKKATTVRGVDKATVFVHGNNALVGLDIKRGMAARSVETKVRNSVKNLQPGYNVHITSDKTLHGRIQQLQARLNGTTGTGTGTGTGTTGTTGSYNTYSLNGLNHTPSGSRLNSYNNNAMRPYALNNGSYNMHGANTPGMYNQYYNNSYGTNGTYRGTGLDDATRGIDLNGTFDNNRSYRGLGLDGTSRGFGLDGTNRGLGLDGTNRMFGFDGTNRDGVGFGNNYSQNHPIRSMADDVGDLIRDIGNTITYPLR